MKSLIESFPFRMATSLSKPMAIPPWGGAPYLNEFIRNPN